MSVYSPAQWQSIVSLGHRVDQDLQSLGIGLTMGGEPTYVSATDLTSLQWRYQALGDDKRRVGEQLLRQLRQDLAPKGALLHHGVGKLYPGEPFPRWALGCFWREDSRPLWQNSELLTDSPRPDSGWPITAAFMAQLTASLGLPFDMARKAYDGNAHNAVGYVLPLLPVSTAAGPVWASCAWKFDKQEQDVVLGPGPQPAGMRLPLGNLHRAEALATEATGTLAAPSVRVSAEPLILADNSIQIALCLEMRRNRLHVFMPPLQAVRGYVDLLAAVERAAQALQHPIVIEGYRPPINQGIQGFQITPDPGVLEVNIHPAHSWKQLVDLHTVLDRAAAQCGLGTIRYERDGRPIDTGGGAHITLGGQYPHESPLVRRPDLIRSFVTYWQHHPSLSYLFAGQFVGPTSQSPRVDETHPHSLEQVEMAFSLLHPDTPLPPKVVDDLLHHLLVDMTGNTHRADFCIDKLYPLNNPPLQLGLLELRGFAMPPDGQMRLLQMLLVRACVAWFWQTPYLHRFKPWGATLHDQYLLPDYIQQDFAQVILDLNKAGYKFQADWFYPFLEFRCPIYGTFELPNMAIELRHALEPWPVLADETNGSSPSRPVDDTTERIQIKLRQTSPGSDKLSTVPILRCNGQQVLLHETSRAEEWVAGVRYRARSYNWGRVSAAMNSAGSSQWPLLAQFLTPLSVLRFELYDGETQTPLGGCDYCIRSHGPNSNPGWPTSAPEAKKRWHDRIRPVPPQDCSPLPADRADRDEPQASLVTLDLRDPRQK
jgi:uncharacterized protein (DUF2126 family)